MVVSRVIVFILIVMSSHLDLNNESPIGHIDSRHDMLYLQEIWSPSQFIPKDCYIYLDFFFPPLNLHLSDIEFCKSEVKGVSSQPSPVLSKLDLG